MGNRCSQSYKQLSKTLGLGMSSSTEGLGMLQTPPANESRVKPWWRPKKGETPEFSENFIFKTTYFDNTAYYFFNRENFALLKQHKVFLNSFDKTVDIFDNLQIFCDKKAFQKLFKSSLVNVQYFYSLSCFFCFNIFIFEIITNFYKLSISFIKETLFIRSNLLFNYLSFIVFFFLYLAKSSHNLKYCVQCIKTNTIKIQNSLHYWKGKQTVSAWTSPQVFNLSSNWMLFNFQFFSSMSLTANPSTALFHLSIIQIMFLQLVVLQVLQLLLLSFAKPLIQHMV